MLKQYNEPSDSNNHQKVLATSLGEVNHFYPQTEVIIVLFKNLCSSQSFLRCMFFAATVNRNEWFCMKTHFDTEAKHNSEVAY